MANHRQAVKRYRQSVTRRSRNRHYKSTMRSLVKQVRKAVETGDTAEAKKALERALPMVDRVAGKGIIHRNTAARTKARLVRLVRKAG